MINRVSGDLLLFADGEIVIGMPDGGILHIHTDSPILVDRMPWMVAKPPKMHSYMRGIDVSPGEYVPIEKEEVTGAWFAVDKRRLHAEVKVGFSEVLGRWLKLKE